MKFYKIFPLTLVFLSFLTTDLSAYSLDSLQRIANGFSGREQTDTYNRLAEEAIAKGCVNFTELCNVTGAGLGCGSCKTEVRDILNNAKVGV